jgi:translocation and assembly module TamB
MTLRRIGLWAGGVVGLLILLLAGLYFWLDTQSGRSFVANQIAGYEFENGLKIRIGRIEGSLYKAAVLREVSFGDSKGVFAIVPEARLDWGPFGYLRGVVDVHALTAKALHVKRFPELKEVPSRGEPVLPDLDIRVGRLAIDRIVFAKEIAGQEQVASLSGNARIADRHVVVSATARSLNGDRLVMKLSAVPDDNRFDIAFSLDAPSGGLVAGLVGIEAPIQARLEGKGTWAKWDGMIDSMVGAEPLANLYLHARRGTFSVRGNARPALIMGDGLIGRALTPSADVNLTATFEQRVADIKASVASAALTLAADGIVDLAKGEFRDLALDFRLLQTAILARNVSGDNVRGKILLNGNFGAPTMAYNVTAARLAFGQTTLQGLNASGEAQGDADRMLIPVNARVRRVSGINAAAGGLLTNVALKGDLAYADNRVLSDNLKIRSDRIRATAILVGDVENGIYTGGLKGNVNGYSIDSVGIFNVDADVDLETKRLGYSLTGTIRGRSTQLFSPGARNFLGGQMSVNAGVRYGTDGVLRITRANVIAPQFRLNQGTGTYTGDGGRVVFNGNGYSSRYGPVAVALTGTFERPVARVTASRPGFGVGLSNIVALVTRSRSGYAISLTGATDYGAIAGDFDVLSGTGPMIIDVKRGNFAGVMLAGRLQQARSGPFIGTLNGTGSGFDGTVALSAVGKYQRAQVTGVATNAELQGRQRLFIGRGIIDADIALYDHPQVVADVQVENAVSGATSLAAARVKVNYRGGNGTAQLVAEGRNQVPFRIAANADLTPKLWRIAAKGRANSINFATAAPMRIVPERSGYAIQLATINVGDGTVRLAGRYGNGITLQSRLDDVNLAILNPMLPGLGLGGLATGSLDWSQASLAAFPLADARLEVARFTRTSLGAVSQPVDISLVGRLLPAGGNMRAVIRRRGAAVGRLQVDLKPLPPGSAGWMTRLLAAPLSGGIRYNGPADTLFSLTALPDQRLTGNIGVAADFSGRLQQPQLNGVVRANDLVYENDLYGTRLTQLRVRGQFTNDQLEVTELSARAGQGTIKGEGFVNLSSAKGFPVQLNLDLDRARIARSELIAASATGRINVVNTPGGQAMISGRLRLPETRYKIVRQGSAKVTTLTGVRRKAPAGRMRVSGEADPIASLPANWKLDIHLIANDELFVTGMGLDSEWSAALHITGTSDTPRIAGDMKMVRGTLDFAGRSFRIDSGSLAFNGAATNPTVRVSAAAEADGTAVRVNISGSGNNPQISFASTPTLPQDEILARILFGNSVAELTAVQAVQLAASLNNLRGGGGGLNPLGVLQSATGIDRLRILGADDKTGRGAAVALGQYITNDVYIEIVTDARGYTASQLEISLTPALSLLSQISSFGTSNIGVRYRKDY